MSFRRLWPATRAEQDRRAARYPGAAMVRVFSGLVLAMAAWAAEAPVFPELASARSVYLLPMGNAMDQYMANRLTRSGRFQVVTDPNLADAIFTDRVGEAFEIKFAELYPPPPPPKPEKKETDEDEDDDSKSSKSSNKKKKDDEEDERTIRAQNEAEARRSQLRSFSRGRGNIYLVDRKTKHVIWSTYNLPKNSTPKELDDTAEEIISRLLRDAKPK